MRGVTNYRFTGLPGQFQPDDDVGLFIAYVLLPAMACSTALSPASRFLRVCQAKALSNALMACKSLDSPFSPQYTAIICLSASTL